MAGLGVRIQLPSKIEKIFPTFSSTDQLLPRIGSALSKGMSKRYSTPWPCIGGANTPKSSSAPPEGLLSVITLPNISASTPERGIGERSPLKTQIQWFFQMARGT
jgi:hypothetical protein